MLAEYASGEGGRRATKEAEKDPRSGWLIWLRYRAILLTYGHVKKSRGVQT